MRIEVWSDIVCPWCYIGKRRLERALGSFPHRGRVEVVWRSFQLDPGAPAQAREPLAEHLGRKYGGGEPAGLRMIDQMEAVAAEEGLLYRLRGAQPVNSLDAHRLLHLALEDGADRQDTLKEGLLEAYLMDEADVADAATLTEVAVAAGLDRSRVERVLAGDDFRDAVHHDIERAQAYGAGGVPFFVVDERYAVSGAQPAEVFTQLLERAWADAHPSLEVVGAPDGDRCGPDGCVS
ncbi:DsbA family oxidoreductase [Nocardioides donggukensis]|uniref:DsbA family oxidoreductase n=1 Tax=Nocardioides donggukensis TaxID=2774019 RepID=A0A927K3I1_9ACTN|nr:DsbA family oxidoreductase [Nocardioides donggukensis]MBD8868968.1 DsbA family oxidoreductase [Nocardioides donggukensis]